MDHIVPNVAFRLPCDVIVAAADAGHTLVKAVGCGPEQDAILQGDRKPFSSAINHPERREGVVSRHGSAGS